MPREKSAGAIIYREDNKERFYLLLHYPSQKGGRGHWGFSKGHVEAGETEEQTVLREVREETGLTDIKIIPGFKEYIKYFFKKREENISAKEIKLNDLKVNLSRRSSKSEGGWVFKLVVFFIAKTETKEIKLSGEHVGYAWLPIDEAIKKTTFKNSKLLLKEADEFITKNHQ